MQKRPRSLELLHLRQTDRHGLMIVARMIVARPTVTPVRAIAALAGAIAALAGAIAVREEVTAALAGATVIVIVEPNYLL